ncbi:MAG: hypothetical protein ACLP07_02110 [Terracidiphilus sp.]
MKASGKECGDDVGDEVDEEVAEDVGDEVAPPEVEGSEDADADGGERQVLAAAAAARRFREDSD